MEKEGERERQIEAETDRERELEREERRGKGRERKARERIGKGGEGGGETTGSVGTKLSQPRVDSWRRRHPVQRFGIERRRGCVLTPRDPGQSGRFCLRVPFLSLSSVLSSFLFFLFFFFSPLYETSLLPFFFNPLCSSSSSFRLSLNAILPPPLFAYLFVISSPPFIPPLFPLLPSSSSFLFLFFSLHWIPSAGV